MKSISLFIALFLGTVLQNIYAQDNAADTLQVKQLNENFRKYISSEPILAFGYAQEALEMAKSINYTSGIAAALNNIGVFYRQRGNLQKALENYQLALKINDSIDNHEGKALSLSNIGTVFSLAQDYDKALKHYEEALSIFEQKQDTNRMIGIYTNIGNIFREQGNTDEGLINFQTALNLFESSGSLRDFEPYTGIGNIYYENNNFVQAVAYYQKSLDYSKTKNDANGQAIALNNLALCYLGQSDTDRAIEAAEQALQISQSINTKPSEQQIYQTLADAFYLKNQLKQAFDYLKRHYQIKDSLNSQENMQAIRDLNMVYEMENQQKEIELLRKEAEIKDLSIKNNRLIIAAIIIIIILLSALIILLSIKYAENRRAKVTLEEQNKEILKSKEILEFQKRIIEDKNQNMTDSIQYAKSIQESILRKNDFSDDFPNSFVFFKPKDIVSGDFYWYARVNKQDIIAVVDCTGHGVAGAFMTIIANSLMNQVIIDDQITDPARILSVLDIKVMETLRQKDIEITNHGMDLAIVNIDTESKKITFAGAKRPLLYFDPYHMKMLKGDIFSVGEVYAREQGKSFRNHVIPIDSVSNLYLFTDGFADQFGSEINKKYMIKRFKNLINTIQNQSLPQQGNSLNLEMRRWMGSKTQTDDMLVVGIGINKTI